MSLYNDIIDDLDEAINDIFLKYQEKFDIKDGYIDITDAIYLDECKKKIAQIIFGVLDYERSKENEQKS